MRHLYQNIFRTNNRKKIVVLIDPDNINEAALLQLLELSHQVQVDAFLVGGSLLVKNELEFCVSFIKSKSVIPVILFPGSAMHISEKADAILFLSLISGRNPDLLIGQQMQAAPLLKASGIEVISTGYILVDGGKPTTVSYMSNTLPVPYDKPEIAAATALAGEMLGMKCIYLEAGSGAAKPVSENMIRTVKKNIQVPLMVGGGIRTPEQAFAACEAGADIIVVGNAIEKDPLLLAHIAQAVHSFSEKQSAL